MLSAPVLRQLFLHALQCLDSTVIYKGIMPFSVEFSANDDTFL